MEPKGKPTLTDVDGTVLGRVQLMSIRLVDPYDGTPQMMHEYIEEADDRPNPWAFAEGLKRGIEADWPDHHWAIVGNWRARYLMWVQRQKETGFLSEEDWSPQAYVDCFKSSTA